MRAGELVDPPARRGHAVAPMPMLLRSIPTPLARLGSLPLKARVIVEGALSGMHRARLHGSSVEFAEHKEYSPGDEIRHIDWKAYAKVDRYYVKQFEQESQLTVYLVLDASASMAFAGDGLTKLEYAARTWWPRSPTCWSSSRTRSAWSRVATSAIETLRAAARAARAPPRSARRARARDRPRRPRRRARGARARPDRRARRPQARADRAGLGSLRREDDDSLGCSRRLQTQRPRRVGVPRARSHELTFPYEGLTQFESLEDERAAPGQARRRCGATTCARHAGVPRPRRARLRRRRRRLSAGGDVTAGRAHAARLRSRMRARLGRSGTDVEFLAPLMLDRRSSARRARRDPPDRPAARQGGALRRARLPDGHQAPRPRGATACASARCSRCAC